MFKIRPTKSLRARILILLVGASTIAAVAVAAGSWWIGQRSSRSEMEQRFDAIKSAIQHSTFPLSPAILNSLSELTGAHWMTIDLDDRIASASLPSMSTDAESILDVDFESMPQHVRIDGDDYFAFRFERSRPPSRREDDRSVVVLFEQTRVHASARRAATLPLLTGLSTIAILSGLMYFLTSRWTGRLSNLESQVGQIALGDFNSRVSDDGDDEIGRLGEAINKMTDQLRSLWKNVNQQQSAKLLHQVSAGMAHQLRNTLTGARMAMELHQGSSDAADTEEVRVAIRQLEHAEDYVHRLLALGANASTEPKPHDVEECIDDVKSTHSSIASHLGVELVWEVERNVEGRIVEDGPAFSAAVSNLVLNAMDAGQHVHVVVSVDENGQCRVQVTDDGGGIDRQVSEALFEPFVTSKPEGMGLGLSLVRRTAEQLGGSVRWDRTDGLTRFELSVSTTGRSDESQ